MEKIEVEEKFKEATLRKITVEEAFPLKDRILDVLLEEKDVCIGFTALLMVLVQYYRSVININLAVPPNMNALEYLIERLSVIYPHFKPGKDADS